jgi:hypothetical protein
MAKPSTRHNRLFYLRGWNAAIEVIWDALTELPYSTLTPEQKALRDGIINFLRPLFPDEDSLKERPTNAQLAQKYAISRRTVTNWRRQGCEFENQARVLNWVFRKRITPYGFKLRFAPQIQRRRAHRERNRFRDSSNRLLQQVREAKRAGLL